MSPTWQIVWKDCRRLRWPLVFWAALIAGQFLLGAQILRQVESEPIVLRRTLEMLDGLRLILWVGQVFFGYILVAALVQEDPLSDQRAWWVTRPISGARLLGAKLAALVLCFWVLPLVVMLPWWLNRGYDGREMALASLQLTVAQGGLSLFAFGLATVTTTAASFVVANGVLIFAWICCVTTILVDSPPVAPIVSFTRFCLAILIALGTLVAISVHQFLTRRTLRSWAMLGAGFVLTLLVVRFSTADWMGRYSWAGSEPPELAAVSLQVGQVDFLDNGRTAEADESVVSMRIGVRADHVPADFAFTGGEFQGTLRWPDGMKLERSGWVSTYPGPVAWQLMGAVHAPEEGAGRMQALSRAPSMVIMSRLPRSFVEKLRNQAPVWQGHLQLYVFLGEVVAEVPLKAGAQDGRKGHRVQVLSLEHAANGGLLVDTAESEPVLALDLIPGFYSLMGFGASGRVGVQGMFYALCSRDRTKCLPLAEARQLYTLAGTVGLERRKFSFTAEQLADPAHPNWLDDAVIVKVAFRRVGTVKRDVRTDALIESDFSRQQRTAPRRRP